MDELALLPRTRALLAKCDRPLKEIADGAGVGFEWLRKFKSKASRHDFGVSRVQALHDYLAALPAEITPKPGRAAVPKNRLRA